MGRRAVSRSLQSLKVAVDFVLHMSFSARIHHARNELFKTSAAQRRILHSIASDATHVDGLPARMTTEISPLAVNSILDGHAARRARLKIRVERSPYRRVLPVANVLPQGLKCTNDDIRFGWRKKNIGPHKNRWGRLFTARLPNAGNDRLLGLTLVLNRTEASRIVGDLIRADESRKEDQR